MKTSPASSNKPQFEFDSRVNPYFPHQVLMESTSACQLRCAMCAREDSLKKGTLQIGQMEEWLSVKIMDEVAAVSPKTRLWFCFFGEPTISKQVWKRIGMAKQKGIETTVINSNGNLLIPKIADQLMDSGLDELYVGLDAVTPETYAQIRRRGDYQTVVNNIHYILKNKKPSLKVTVQFGVYAENEHEVEGFKAYWEKFGVPIYIRPKVTWLGALPEHYHTEDPRYPCGWQFDSLPIYWNGLVPYCICDWDNRFPQGDIKTQTIAEVWQTNYRKWQNYHLSGQFEKLPDFCQQCRDWQAKPLNDTMQKIFNQKLSFDDFEMEKPEYLRAQEHFCRQSKSC